MSGSNADSSVARFLAQAVGDHRNGWSMGNFGVIGESVRGAGESTEATGVADGLGFVTGRGGIRVTAIID